MVLGISLFFIALTELESAFKKKLGSQVNTWNIFQLLTEKQSLNLSSVLSGFTSLPCQLTPPSKRWKSRSDLCECMKKQLVLLTDFISYLKKWQQ